MSQQLRFQGIKGDMCNCGRRASIRHCPSCGSARIYAYAHPEYHQTISGQIDLVNQLYRCLSCGHRFVDEERKFCEAPPFGIEDAVRKVQVLSQAKQQGEYLRPEDEKLAQIIDKLQSQAQPKVETEVEEPNKATEQILQQAASQVMEQHPEVSDVINPPEREEDFIPPNGLTRDEYNLAERAFRLEWVNMRLVGSAPTATAEEYVERRLKGELFQ